MFRVLFLIRSLESGGAERQIVELVRHLNSKTFEITVVTYYSGGAFEDRLNNLSNVRLLSAGKRGRWDLVGFLFRLYRLVRTVRPDVVHGYMYGANELALLMGRAIGARVVWGVRASNVDVCQYNWTTRLLFKTGAWLSSRADLIIANSEAGRRYHIGLGYPSQRFIVIPNGIDTSAYHHEGGGRVSVRAEWGMGDTEVLVGIVARLDPMKDHETFIKAASLVADIAPRVRFVIIGADRQNRRVHLETLARDIGVEARIIWAGARSDMTSVYSALDLVTSSSAFGEGFSNSLGEAMACETICVATDVGDARAVIGDTGLVVPVRDAEALARAWFELLKDGSSEMSKRGQHARAHIVNNFGVAALAERTSQAIRSVIKKEC